MSAVMSPDLRQQVESLEQQAVALEQALTTGRWVRTGLIVAISALAAYFAWSFYALGHRLQSQDNIDQILKLAEARLAERSGDYFKEVQTLVDDSTPVLSEAFSAQFKKDFPGYMKHLGEERQAFEEHLQSRLQSYVEKQHAKLITDARGTLEQEFPEASNAQLHARMVDNLTVAMQELTQKYYVDALKQGLERMYKSWDSFPIAAARKQGDPPLEDQLMADLLDVMTMKLVQAQKSGGTGLAEAIGVPMGKASP